MRKRFPTYKEVVEIIKKKGFADDPAAADILVYALIAAKSDPGMTIGQCIEGGLVRFSKANDKHNKSLGWKPRSNGERVS